MMNIYQKLIEVRKTVPYLQKSADGPQFKYVSSSQVLANVKAKMDELGLLLIPAVVSHKVTESTVEYIEKDKYGNEKPKKTTTYFTELDISMTWVDAETEQTIISPWYGQGVDIAGEKGVGKALTYAEKYFMLKFFNIPTDKDDPDSFQQKCDNGESPKEQPKSDSPKEPPKTDVTPSDLEKRATAIYFQCTGNKEGQLNWSKEHYKEQLKQWKEEGHISTDYGKKWTLKDIEWLEKQIEDLPF